MTLRFFRTKHPVATICACAVECWRALGRRGVAPALRCLICVQSGAVPTLALAGAGLGHACLLSPPLWPVFLYCGVMVLGWYVLCGPLVGGLLVGDPRGDCVGVFGWLPMSGVVGLRSGADIHRLCVCLRWFPALAPACVYWPTIASLCNTRFFRQVNLQSTTSSLIAQLNRQ